MSDEKKSPVSAEKTAHEVQALLKELPPAPRAGDKVELDAVFRRLLCGDQAESPASR